MHGMHRVCRRVGSEHAQVGHFNLLLVLRLIVDNGRMRDDIFGPRLKIIK